MITIYLEPRTYIIPETIELGESVRVVGARDFIISRALRALHHYARNLFVRDALQKDGGTGPADVIVLTLTANPR